MACRVVLPPPWPAGFFVGPQTDRNRPTHVKRAATPWSLLDHSTPWLRWWQELILNWVSSWETVGDLTVSSADGEAYCSWELPTDIGLKRMELEELLK